ncbi:MAG: ATP synthase subunit I [Turicibacter sp.]
MSQLQKDPIRMVPKRVLILGVVFTAILTGVAMVFKWPVINILIGYWLGVVVNLINFRLIVIGARNALEKRESGAKGSMMSNLVGRLLIYAGTLVLAVQFGTHAFIAAIIGISMVRIAIQTDGFFTFGLTKEEK